MKILKIVTEHGILHVYLGVQLRGLDTRGIQNFYDMNTTIFRQE